jgi:hypothetical protein
LDAFGFGDVENARDISALHRARAAEENLKFEKANVTVEEFDDHEIHVIEHTRYLLSTDFEEVGEEKKKRAVQHLQQHKRFLKAENAMGQQSVEHSSDKTESAAQV